MLVNLKLNIMKKPKLERRQREAIKSRIIALLNLKERREKENDIPQIEQSLTRAERLRAIALKNVLEKRNQSKNNEST